jgi:transcriptional regulator NrdR family protein
VAYLRFASVYRGFESADDFETDFAMLRDVVGKLRRPRHQ